MKNEEATKQFEQIYRDSQDQELQARKRKKQKQEEELKIKKEDLGL